MEVREGSKVGLVAANVLNFALIALLFFTAYARKIPQHPVVKTLLAVALPRSIIAAMPVFHFEELVYKLPWRLDIRGERIEYQDTWLGRFCAAQGIVMYFFLTAQAFFAISFTLPMLWIAMQSPKLWKERSHVKLPPNILLCLAPFLWALPTIIVAIPTLRYKKRNNYPGIYFTPMGYCTIDSRIYQMVSAILVGVPLIVSVALVVFVLRYIVKFYTQFKGVPRKGRVIDVSLLVRFAGMLSILLLNSIFLLCEISLHDSLLEGLWRLDFYWCTITPLIEFLLFGTQRVYLEAWADWFRKFFCWGRRSRSDQTAGAADEEAATSQDATGSDRYSEPTRPPRSRGISTVSLEHVDNDDAPPIQDDGEGLCWSSDEDEMTTPGGASSRKPRRRTSALFQWDTRPPKSDRDPPPAPPTIVVESTSHAGPSGPTRQNAIAQIAEEPPPLAEDVTPIPQAPDGVVSSPGPRRNSRPRPRRNPDASASPTDVVRRPSDNLTSQELLRGYPLTPMRSTISDSSAARLVAGPGSGSESDSPPSSEGEYGKALTYLYSEMHMYLGMPTLRNPRRNNNRARVLSPVDMHRAARLTPDGDRRPRRQGSTSSSLSRAPVDFAWDQKAGPSSLSTVDETLAELPPQEFELVAPRSVRRSSRSSSRFASAHAMWPPDGLAVPEHDELETHGRTRQEIGGGGRHDDHGRMPQ